MHPRRGLYIIDDITPLRGLERRRRSSRTSPSSKAVRGDADLRVDFEDTGTSVSRDSPQEAGLHPPYTSESTVVGDVKLESRKVKGGLLRRVPVN